MSETETFNKLKYPRYKLIIELLPDDEDQIDDIINGMRTTIDREPEFDDNGNLYYENLSLEEICAEVFCLGICYREIENSLGMEVPFEYYVESDW